MTNEILLILDKADPERDSLAEVWKNNGGEVMRIGKFWERPLVDSNKKITIYGTDTFSLVLAQMLELDLVEPKDELISQLDFKGLKRSVEVLKISDLAEPIFPIFIKPVKPKIFKAGIYNDLNSFFHETKGIEKSEKIIVSSIIDIESEVRAFILHHKILDMAVYEGNADLRSAKAYLTEFLENHRIELPATYVVDLGYNVLNGWFIIEFNSSWGAGLNSCNPTKVMSGIRAATVKKTKNNTLKNITFREARVDDIKQIQIVRHSVKENILSDPSLVTDEDCKTFITDRGKGWVCEINTEIVGFSIVDLTDKNIWALFLKPEFEKQGIGRKLHDMMLNWYFEQTTDAVWLSTSPHTRAELFYRKSGWEETGTYGKGEIKFEMTYDKWNNKD